MPRYEQLTDGEWVTPVMTGYRLACCDCSLVHRIDFKVSHVGSRHSLKFRATRITKATTALRKRQKAK